MSATFNQPNASNPEEGAKELNFDDNDPFEILVNPTPSSASAKESTGILIAILKDDQRLKLEF